MSARARRLRASREQALERGDLEAAARLSAALTQEECRGAADAYRRGRLRAMRAGDVDQFGMVSMSRALWWAAQPVSHGVSRGGGSRGDS